jgi:DNA-binding CsgD family transcriptional regulator
MLSLAIVPVGETLEAGRTEGSALLVFGRRQVCEPLSVQFFAREHRLTTAETAVLHGLAEGLRPAEIAKDAGVPMSTVRTQITSIRLKTGARSIGELVRLVTVLPPIVPLPAS